MDFDQGTRVNVSDDEDQLRLAMPPTTFPFINVAASARGTMVRINTDTGVIVGEYKTAPETLGLDPSRTTVDGFGNVWAGNRGETSQIEAGGDPYGSVVKIGLVVGGTRVDSNGTGNPAGDYLAPPFTYNTCEDRDRDGLIKTSRGLGDIRPWPLVNPGDWSGGVLNPTGSGLAGNARVEDADDECILVYQRLQNAPVVRHVSVDGDNNVWVGGYPDAPTTFHKLDNETGAILNNFPAWLFGCGGYGGLVDGNGILWSAGKNEKELLRFDTVANSASCEPVGGFPYGLGIDTNGFIWASACEDVNFGNLIAKFTPAGDLVTGFPKVYQVGYTCTDESFDRGVTITPADNHVWVANSSRGPSSRSVARLDNEGDLVKFISLIAVPNVVEGRTPTGVAVDSNGYVWVTNQTSNNVMRIDPNGGGDGKGAVVQSVEIGPGAGPYNYSDMTGLVRLSAVRQGTWTVVQDGGRSLAEWDTITWNTEPEGGVPDDTSIVVHARAADDQSALSSEAFVEVDNGVALGGALTGQFIEVQVTLKGAEGVDSPVLSDIRVLSNQDPDCAQALPNVDMLWPPNHRSVPVNILGVTDPDGDAVSITIDSIFQDEPVDTFGDGRFVPDGWGVGTASAEVRAERSGTKKVPGNGRVYHIAFTAADYNGGTCGGEVTVGVPHDRGGGSIPVDDGALYDSTVR
jgi:streptogramin lyase